MARTVERLADRRFTLLSATITAAVANTAATVVDGLAGAHGLTLQSKFSFTVSGTSADAWVQTSFDSGANWADIAQFNYSGSSGLKVIALTHSNLTSQLAPTSGGMADNTLQNGLIGDRLRVRYVTVGSFTGGTFEINGVSKG